MPKAEKKKPEVSRSDVAARLGSMSQNDLSMLFNLYGRWLQSGSSSLMNAYGSQIGTADFIHSMGLMTDGAYNAIFLLSNVVAGIAAGESVITGLFGNNAFQPVLKSYVDQTGVFAGGGDERSFQNALNAFKTQGITDAIMDVLTTGEETAGILG